MKTLRYLVLAAALATSHNCTGVVEIPGESKSSHEFNFGDYKPRIMLWHMRQNSKIQQFFKDKNGNIGTILFNDELDSLYHLFSEGSYSLELDNSENNEFSDNHDYHLLIKIPKEDGNFLVRVYGLTNTDGINLNYDAHYESSRIEEKIEEE